jgi:hypothetical protein
MGCECLPRIRLSIGSRREHRPELQIGKETVWTFLIIAAMAGVH